MLERITINNVALIDSLTIEFGAGLNVLSGETGAGKSLIIDSISLLLGERADKGLISFGENQASVEAVFSCISREAVAVLDEFGVDHDTGVIIFRKITADGKNECRVNGRNFTLSMLKKLTTPLMDLHGQFSHQSILSSANHINILDEFDKINIVPAREAFGAEFEKLIKINHELTEFTTDERERERQIELFKYQIDEIEDANFLPQEDEELKQAQLKISHAERIADGINSAAEVLGRGSGDVLSNLKRAQVFLSGISAFEPKLEAILLRLESVRLETDDIFETIADMVDDEVLDGLDPEAVSRRLDLLSSFKKKYGQTIDEINAYHDKIKAEYEKLTNCAEYVQNLLNQKVAILKSLTALGKNLTDARKKAAAAFEAAVTKELKDVGMGGSKFIVKISENGVESASKNGLDTVEFMFSANVGQPPKPLAKVISGGEMSRFMLALKNITADIENISTMIFDEIDTGVSGQMAKVLAQKMLTVGARHQVLCVTHMAQICAFASTNFFIKKEVIDGQTRTRVTEIKGDDKVLEVARLVGSSASASAQTHAKELIAEGQEYRKMLTRER